MHRRLFNLALSLFAPPLLVVGGAWAQEPDSATPAAVQTGPAEPDNSRSTDRATSTAAALPEPGSPAVSTASPELINDLSVDLFDAIDFLGEWLLEYQVLGQARTLELKITPEASTDQANIRLLEDGNEVRWRLRELRPKLSLAWQIPGRTVVLDLSPGPSGQLLGHLLHPNGLFEIPVLGHQTNSPPPPPSRDEDPIGLARSIVELGGATIELIAPSLLATSPDYLKARDLDRGETLKWLEGPPITLVSALPIHHQDGVLPPGTYSLWLRLVAPDRWILIANKRLPERGNAYQEGADLAVWELEFSVIESTTLSAGLQSTATDSVDLLITWGKFRWTQRWAVDLP